jgi:serine/threonine protein kinase
MESFPDFAEGSPEKSRDIIETSKSLELLEGGLEAFDKYRQENLKEDLKEEVERILSEERFLGEGRAAKVHAVDAVRSQCKVAAKIWRPELQKILAQDVMDYRRIQTMEPHDEFSFQDELYTAGFRHMARPYTFVGTEEHQTIAMEEIPGYTLKQIIDSGAKIEEPAWSELKKIILELNNEFGVVHRDLHEGNIMLQTNDKLEPDARLKGELKLLDFGCSKRISFSSPEPDDFKLTIGQKTIEFPQDSVRVLGLKPNARGTSPFTH